MKENNEFYKKLKQISVEVEKEGYFLDWAYGGLYLGKGEKIDNLVRKNRVSFYMRKVFDNSEPQKAILFFSADISTLAGGNNYYTIEECRKFVKYWSHMLDVCERLNNLNIVGTVSDYKTALELINSRKRK